MGTTLTRDLDSGDCGFFYSDMNQKKLINFNFASKNKIYLFKSIQ